MLVAVHALCLFAFLVVLQASGGGCKRVVSLLQRYG